MKIGAERNKLILLGVVLVILAITVYVQFFASSQPIAARTRVPPARPAAASVSARQPSASRTTLQTRGQGFRPRFAPGSSDQPLDPMTVDPTLRTDLLAKVRSVTFEGVERNLFQFGERKKAVPPPSAEAVAKAQERLKNLPQPKPAPKAATTPSKASKAPPIQFKYYGFANGPDDPQKRAFLLDGEEILIGTEGDVFKKRYKIVRIGVNSIVVEDLKFKEEQTLRLEES